MTVFQQQLITTALNNMFNHKSYFDICAVRECLKIAGIPEPAVVRDMAAVHCVDWGKMPQGMKETLARQLFDVFQTGASELSFDDLFLPTRKLPAPVVEAVEVHTHPASEGIFRRLLPKH